MQDSIFTKIIKGEIPSYKIYEDNYTYAFLDIHPVTQGHTLVVPKQQVEFVWDLDKSDYASLMDATQKVALRLREILDVLYVGEQVVGVDVPHAHIHLIPFETVEQYRYVPDMSSEIDHAALTALAQRLAF